MYRSALLGCLVAASCTCTSDPAGDDAPDDVDPTDVFEDTDALVPPPRVAEVTVTDNPKMVLEKRFAITLPAGVSSATLRCISSDDPLEDHRLAVAGPESEVRLYGILAEHSYDCTLEDDLGLLWQGSFLVEPLPDRFPTLDVSGYDADRATLDDGYTLFNHWKRAEGNHRIMLIDSEGRVRWYVALLEAEEGGISARWLGDGEVLIGGGKAIEPGIYNLSGEVQFQVAEAITIKGYHHEALLTPEGWIVSLQSTDDIGPGGETFTGFRIEATDPLTGVVMWQFDSQTAINAGTLEAPPGEDPDPFHANAISWVDDDPEDESVWVCMRGINAIARIDRATREITTLFGPDRGSTLLAPSGAPLDEEDWFWGVHAPEIEQGSMHGDPLVFTVFDNGASRPVGGNYSRIATFRRDSADQATLLWEWTEDGWYEKDFGSVRRTTANSFVIGSGHCNDCPADGNDNAWILEVDIDSGEVLWRYDFTEESDTIYRAEAVDRCAFPNLRYCAEAALP